MGTIGLGITKNNLDSLKKRVQELRKEQRRRKQGKNTPAPAAADESKPAENAENKQNQDAEKPPLKPKLTRAQEELMKMADSEIAGELLFSAKQIKIYETTTEAQAKI